MRTVDLKGSVNVSNIWKFAAVLAVVLTLALSGSAFGDSYNFYFPSAKKKSKHMKSAPTPAEDTSEEEETEEESAPSEVAEEAITEPAAPKAEIKAEKDHSEIHQTQTVPAGNVPIVINNNISTNATNSNAHALPTPVAPAPAPAPIPQAHLDVEPLGNNSAVVSSSGNYKKGLLDNNFRIGVGAAHFTDWSSQNSGPRQMWGGVITMGFDFSRHLGMNVYFGGRDEMKGTDIDMAGAELELMPFRSELLDFHPIELGFLGGFGFHKQYRANTYQSYKGWDSASRTAIYANETDTYSKTVSNLYVGARFNVNFNRSFGVTAVARANQDQVLYEAGIIARF